MELVLTDRCKVSDTDDDPRTHIKQYLDEKAEQVLLSSCPHLLKSPWDFPFLHTSASMDMGSSDGNQLSHWKSS